MSPALGRRAAARSFIEKASIPAPVKLLNTVDAGSELPPGFCMLAINLVAAENGVRSRYGSREWCTGLTGLLNNEVRTTIGYSGSAKNGTADRKFACTNTGIWDVSASSPSPSQVLTFSTQNGEAGYGVAHAFVTSAGHFLIYCDEENGAFFYKESTDTWAAIVTGVTQAWAANTGYIIGNQVTNGGNVYICDTNGTSDVSGGPSGTGANIVDATTRWDYVSAVTANAIGPSLSDQNLSRAANPANFSFVMSWKSRLFFIEKNSQLLWYLEAGSIFGTVNALNLDRSAQLRKGGPLVGAWNWTLDSGVGIDDHLVICSQGGDVVVYAGTDPASADSFGLRGVWGVEGFPKGRRVATRRGGDILLLTKAGLVPLSQIVSGADGLGEYETGAISNLFNALMLTQSTLPGWSVHIHPEDNSLIVTYPTNEGQATEQLAMGLQGKGWSRYKELPIYSADVAEGKFYFGTVDGRIMVNDGYIDGVLLSDASAFTPVQWQLLTAFFDFGSPNQKQVQMIRPMIRSDDGNPSFEVAARYNYDTTALASVSPPTLTGGDTWDSGLWDTAVWAGEYVSSHPIRGASGMGVDIAIAMRGAAISRTIITKIDITFVQGGYL